ncbi:hypothetical protein ACHAXA_009638 [Cyclostephanos tholiformis]|uniref:Uncharacterized protein n=1 Tax=Cyclostephanos tholiformis TaxID=382380 RepID=A0ABD3SE14_9STRA
MKYQTIFQLSWLLVGNPSSGGYYVRSLEQREPNPAIRGGGGLRRNLNGIVAFKKVERLLEGDEDGAADDEAAEDSANGGAVAFASRVQNWESAAISKFNDWQSTANSTAWEFYDSPPSQWTEHQWDLVFDLILGLGSIIILCCICCVNICSSRGVEKAPTAAPAPLSPKAAPRHTSRSAFWGNWSPTGSSFLRGSSVSTSWSPRRSRRRHRGGARDRRQRLIDSDDDTEKHRGGGSDDDESTDDDSTVESRTDQSTAYEPPECTMSDETNESILFSSFDGSESEFSGRKPMSPPPNEVNRYPNKTNQDPVEAMIDTYVGKIAITDEKKGTQRQKSGEEVTTCPSISVENKIDSIGVGTQASTRNPGMNVFMYNNKEKDTQGGEAMNDGLETSPRNRGISNSMSGDWKKKLQDMKKRMDQRKSALSPDFPPWKDRKPSSLAVDEGSKKTTGEDPVLTSATTLPLVSTHVDGRSRETDEAKTVSGSAINSSSMGKMLGGELDGQARETNEVGTIAAGTKARELEELIRDVLENPVGVGEAKKRRKKKKERVVL